MSASELDELEALLVRVLANPSGFAEKVLQQLMDRLTAATPARPPTVVAGQDALADQQLSDHNLLLAAALGACDCWGADADCPVCSGAGAAGWTDPDPGLFAEYAAPAVARAGARSLAAHDDIDQRQPAEVPGPDGSAAPPGEGGSR